MSGRAKSVFFNGCSIIARVKVNAYTNSILYGEYTVSERKKASDQLYRVLVANQIVHITVRDCFAIWLVHGRGGSIYVLIILHICFQVEKTMFCLLPLPLVLPSTVLVAGSSPCYCGACTRPHFSFCTLVVLTFTSSGCY